MAGGYSTPPGDGLGVLTDELVEIRRRLRELEQPTGSQLSGNLAYITQTTIVPAEIQRFDSSPAITGTLTQFATLSTPVPAGFTTAVVSLTAVAGLRNDETDGTWSLLTLAAAIEGVGTGIRTMINGGKYGSAASARADVLTGLAAGSSVDVGAFVMFVGAYSLASVSVSGSILFLR